MTEAVSLPLGVPAFRRIPSNPYSVDDRTGVAKADGQDSFTKKASMYPQDKLSVPISNLTYRTTSVIQKIPHPNMPTQTFEVPAFQAMPSSVSRIATGQIVPMNHNSVYSNNVNNIKREVCWLRHTYLSIYF